MRYLTSYLQCRTTAEVLMTEGLPTLLYLRDNYPRAFYERMLPVMDLIAEYFNKPIDRISIEDIKIFVERKDGFTMRVNSTPDWINSILAFFSDNPLFYNFRKPTIAMRILIDNLPNNTIYTVRNVFSEEKPIDVDSIFEIKERINFSLLYRTCDRLTELPAIIIHPQSGLIPKDCIQLM